MTDQSVRQRAGPMIEINTAGFGYMTRQYSFDFFMRLLRDEIIRPDSFIEFIADDGIRAAVRKSDIISINEVEE